MFVEIRNPFAVELLNAKITLRSHYSDSNTLGGYEGILGSAVKPIGNVGDSRYRAGQHLDISAL